MLLCESPVSSLHSRISGFQNSSGFRSKNGVEFFPYMSVTKALIEMMEEMPFEDIKVKELCDRAMIRKSTFYKHFADKYELLAFIVKEVINDYNERIRQDSPTDDPVAFYNKMMDYVFEFAKANQKLIRSAIRSDSLVLLLNIMSQQVMPDICQKLKGSGPRPPYASFPGGHGDILCGRYFRKSAQLVHKRQKVLRGGHQKTAQRHHASCVSGGKHTGTKRMIQNLSGLTRNPNSIQYERAPAASAAGGLSPRQKLTPEKISAYFVNFCRQTGGAIL